LVHAQKLSDVTNYHAHRLVGTARAIRPGDTVPVLSHDCLVTAPNVGSTNFIARRWSNTAARIAWVGNCSTSQVRASVCHRFQ